MNEADGACTRAKFNALLGLQNGAVIGYKAGLTNPAVQKRFGYDKPVWGVLYEGTEALAKEGRAMKPGELISLGSFSPLAPPKPGLKVTATYTGLPGAAPVSVTFR